MESRRWCFSCSQRSQSGTGTSSGRSASRLEPGLRGGAQAVVAAQAQREGEVGEPDVVLGEQLAQGAQALQLGRAVEAVAGLRARGLNEPDALDVAQHARRPARGLRSLVDREGVHPGDKP